MRGLVEGLATVNFCRLCRSRGWADDEWQLSPPVAFTRHRGGRTRPMATANFSELYLSSRARAIGRRQFCQLYLGASTCRAEQRS